MIIFYYGTDAYRVTEATQDVIARYREKYSGGLNFFRVDVSEKDALKHLQDTLRTSPLFQDTKLIQCTHAFDTKAPSAEFLDVLKSFSLETAKDTAVCVTGMDSASELTKSDKQLFAYLERHAKPLKEFSAPIAPPEPNIFALTDAIASRNKHLAIELLYRELHLGRDPHHILSMIVFQFRNLLAIKDLLARNTPSANIPKLSGLAPFIIKKSSAQARQFSLQELKSFFSRCAELEVAAKQGKVHLEDELWRMVIGTV